MTLLEQLRQQSPSDRAHTLRLLVADLRAHVEATPAAAPSLVTRGDLRAAEQALKCAEQALRKRGQ